MPTITRIAKAYRQPSIKHQDTHTDILTLIEAHTSVEMSKNTTIRSSKGSQCFFITNVDHLTFKCIRSPETARDTFALEALDATSMGLLHMLIVMKLTEWRKKSGPMLVKTV